MIWPKPPTSFRNFNLKYYISVYMSDAKFVESKIVYNKLILHAFDTKWYKIHLFQILFTYYFTANSFVQILFLFDTCRHKKTYAHQSQITECECNKNSCQSWINFVWNDNFYF